MKNNARQLLASLAGLIFLLPMSALAHTGGAEATGFSLGLIHPIGGLDHLLAMVAVGLWAGQMGGRALWVLPVSFVSVMIAGAIAGLSGFFIPFVEGGILTSVLVLGVLVAGVFRFSVGASAGIVGVLALVHGCAHGNELPMATGAAAFFAGLALSTLLLHTVGLALWRGLQRVNIENIQRMAGGAIALSGIYLAL